jgi:hypothetical protein
MNLQEPKDENRTLKPEYREVRFRCASATLPACFYIVTAHNPDGVAVAEEVNTRADAALRREIERLGFAFFSVTGGSPDFSHAEPGYGIQCSREEALGLARQFRQDAFFEIQEGKVILISALPLAEPDEFVGLWRDLLSV